MFGAGILGLQLCYPQINLQQQVYHGHEYSSGSAVNSEVVMQLVCGVVDMRLRNKLAILTSTHPGTRKNIYQIIEHEVMVPSPREKVRLAGSPTMSRTNSSSLQTSQVNATARKQQKTSVLKTRSLNSQ